jgi:hypothetical protein
MYFSEKLYKKKMIVNGKPVVNIELRNTRNNKKEIIKGHYGNKPINIQRTFRKRKRRKR